MWELLSKLLIVKVKKNKNNEHHDTTDMKSVKTNRLCGSQGPPPGEFQSSSRRSRDAGLESPRTGILWFVLSLCSEVRYKVIFKGPKFTVQKENPNLYSLTGHLRGQARQMSLVTQAGVGYFPGVPGSQHKATQGESRGT